jgi:hypothetical protein
MKEVALLAAAKAGNFGFIADLLADEGVADVSHKDPASSLTALHLACMNGHPEVGHLAALCRTPIRSQLYIQLTVHITIEKNC